MTTSAAAPWLRAAVRSVAISVLYVTAWLALSALTPRATEAAPPPWFLPPALTLFVLVTFGVRYAPLVVVAHVLRSLLHPAASAGLLGEVLEGVVAMVAYGGAAGLLRERFSYDPGRRRIRDLSRVVAIAGLAAPLVVAAGYTSIALANATISADRFVATLVELWIGHAVGIVALLPGLTTFVTPAARRIAGLPVAPRPPRVPSLPPTGPLETAAQIVALAVTLTVGFGTGGRSGSSPVLYLYFLPLAWIVLRRGLAGAIIANAGTDLTAMLLTGALGYSAAAERNLQTFMLAVTLTSLLLGSVVSSRARAERKLVIAREQLSRAEEASSTMILHISLEGICLKVPATFCALLGYRSEDLQQMRCAELVAGEDRPALELALHRLVMGEARSVETEARFITRSGRLVWIYLTASAVPGIGGHPGFLLVFAHDVTAQRQQTEEVAYLAYHDALTGLPNRSMLQEHLSPALERARRTGRGVAAIFVDLDGFKAINDTLGHAAGDEVLRQVAGRLRRTARATDLVARLSGDEFLVLITDIERAAGEEEPAEFSHAPLAVAAGVHRALEPPFILPEHRASLSASLGISIFPIDANDALTLVEHADAAMYRAKRSHAGETCLYGGPDRVDEPSPVLEARLARAVERRSLRVCYQPIVELSMPWGAAAQPGDLARATVGIEAQLRSEDPGELPWGEARLSMLDSAGVPGDAGALLTEGALREAASWPVHGRAVPLWLKLSTYQLHQLDAAERLLARMGETQLDPKRVVVEIAEAMAAAHPESVARVAAVFRAAGARVAIDGFGTVGSSLANLQALDLESLKVDRSWIARVPDDERAVAVVAAALAIARSLKMTAVAEGVESERQAAALLEMGYALGQGEFFSPTLSADEVRSLLAGITMV